MKKILLAVLIPFALYAQNGISVYDAYMNGQARIFGFNGNVLVAKNGVVIYKKSFGFADYNTKAKLDSNSIFDCGSIAKEFTAMAILLLKDQGKINYTDSLGKFFPELPYSGLTIQQLLTHTSGMPDGFDLVEKYFDHNKIATNKDLIQLLEKYRPALNFKPGENLMYSGTAFNLLASVIEKISGQSYNEFLNEHIFLPLGMKHTRVSNEIRAGKHIPGLAYGFVYSDSLKNYVRAETLNTGWTSYFSAITGEGMIISTTGDLFKWDRSIKNYSLLSKATQQEMLTVHAEKKFPKVAFGYGIRVGRNDFGNYIFHNGYFPGYLSMLIRYTDDDVTVVVLSNNESHAEFIADGLSAIALNEKIILPVVHKEKIQDKLPANFSAKYMMALTRPPYLATFPVEFIWKNNSLFIHPFAGPDIRLRPESAQKYFFADGTDQQIEFQTDDKGEILNLWHIAWGLKKELKKME